MKLDDIKKLNQKKYREAFGHFLVEGEHPILELQKAAQSNPQWRNCKLYATESFAHWQSPFDMQIISERQMLQIADTKTPQGIVAVAPIPAAPQPGNKQRPGNQKALRAIYLHEVQDPGNLGTILRTLAWFGNFICLLSPNSVDPYNPKVVRASMGAIFHVPLELDIEFDALRARYPRIACLDMTGEKIQSPQFSDFDCYIFGNEARGVPREKLTEIAAQPFTIAGGGAVESLNLASAVSVCVYELERQPINEQ